MVEHLVGIERTRVQHLDIRPVTARKVEIDVLETVHEQDFLALHFSQTRPPAEQGRDHRVIVVVAQQIEQAQQLGEVDADVNSMNSAVFFLLGLYALLTTTHGWPTQREMLDDYVARSLRSIEAR